MLTLVLLAWFWMPIQGQNLDYNSWTDQAVLSDGLCRYGNSVDCCWGWRRMERGPCQPDCQQGCKHGDCVGPDRCKCHPGYSGKACNQDLNECGVKPRPCKHRCMNTPGSYKCYCLDGHAPQPDGSCRNVRTCYHANCQYGCEVMRGQVRCTCPSPGLRLGPDRRSCVDIDECALGGGVCPRRRKCMNTFGSFFCKCHLGFRLMYINGRYACIDKDTRPFCSLNPSSPKCRCKDGSCKGILTVALEPPRPRSTTPITTSATTSTTPTTTTVIPTTTTTIPTTTTVIPTTTTTIPTTTTVIPTTTTTIPTPTTPPTATPTTLSSTAYPTTAALTTTVIATTSMAPSTVALTTRSPTTPPVTTTPTTAAAATARATPTPEATPTSGPAVYTPVTIAVTTATTTLPTTSLVTTTLNNRINKDVTQRQRGDVHIPRQPGHNHVWEFDIELGNTAEDARDDPEAGELRCSFDHGLCDWISDRDGDVHWEAVDSPRGGRHLSVPELKAGQRSIRGARLAVRIVPLRNQGEMCFSFSHWLTGHHMGVLQLFIREKGRDQRYGSSLWSRTGGHGWRQTQVTLETRSVDKVLIKAERRSGRRGQIAVDDVTLRHGACR